MSAIVTSLFRTLFAGLSILMAFALLTVAPETLAQGDTVTVPAAEFQRMVYSAHLLTQMDAKPELDASLRVLLELQRRNAYADPAALAGVVSHALQRYRNTAPAYIRTNGCRNEVLAAYLEVLMQVPARTNFVPANMALLHQLITRAPAPADEPQAGAIHSGSGLLLGDETDLEQRQLLLEDCTRRAQGSAVFAQAMERLLLPETAVSLANTPAQIIGNTNSPLNGNLSMQTLLALSLGSGNGSLTVSSNQLMTLFTNDMLTLRQTVITNLALRAEINQTRSNLLSYLANPAAIAVNVDREVAVKRGQARQIASATAAILVHSKLMEAGNTFRLPEEIQAAGSALSTMAKGIQTITEVGAGGFTKFTAAGSVLGGAMKIFSLLSGAESPEDQIVREMGNIKLMIGDLATNMNYRFDRVDQSLTQIFDTLNQRFDQIEITQAMQGRWIANLHADLDQVRLSLLDVQTEVYRLERNLATFHALDWRMNLIENMNLGLGYEGRTGRPMAYDLYVPSYVSMENVFYTHAYNRAVAETLSRSETLPFAEADLYYQLSADGGTNVCAETLNYLKKNLRQRLSLSDFAATPYLANPQDWAAGAGAWLQLAVENPTCYRRYMGALDRLDPIISRGRDLTNFVRSLTFSGTGINWGLYSALLSYYSGKLTNFVAQVQTTEQQYATDNHFFLETLRQWDPPAPRFTATATAVVAAHNEAPVVPAEYIPAGGWPQSGTMALGGDMDASQGLALQSGGRIAAWGANDFGQTSLPTGLSNIVALAAGPYHSVALRSNGTVVAWGDNSYGKSTSPAMASNVVAVCAGVDRTLAVRADGRVVGWGYNTFGQATGVPTPLSPQSSTGLVVVAGQTLTNAVAVDTGEYFSLALKADGTVVAWGMAGHGETNVPAGLSGVMAIASGLNHCVALRSNGTLAVWGWNNVNQTNVPSECTNVVAIAAGMDHTLALRSNGTVVAWGYNGQGQTSVPTGLSNVVAIAASDGTSLALRRDGTFAGWGATGWYWEPALPAPAGLSNVVAVASGSGHALALRADGSVLAWGDNSYGQSTVPPDLTNVAAIAAGNYHSLALKADGRVVGWGTGYWNYGQTNAPSDLTNAVAIAAGAEYSVALKSDGRVVSWGRPLQNTPTDLTNIVAVATDRYYCLALTIEGRVRAWGDNYYGQCNVPPEATSGVMAIAAGGDHCLALRADGTVVRWGRDDYGNLAVPAGLSNVVAISAGNWHSAAFRSDGTAVLWGVSDMGQAHVPAEATNILAVAAGGNYTFFLTGANNPMAQPLRFIRAPAPGFVYALLQGANRCLLTNLDLDLHSAGIELAGAKALLQSVLEVGLPHTVERDDVLHGFLYGSEALADLENTRSLLNDENRRLNAPFAAAPALVQQVAPLRLTRFTERLQSRLSELAASGQPEIPRLVGHTLRLLYLLRDAWAAVPAPTLEAWPQTNSPQLALFGEPYAHYTLQYRDSVGTAGWTNSSITNLQSDQAIAPPVSGSKRFYRAVLPAP